MQVKLSDVHEDFQLHTHTHMSGENSLYVKITESRFCSMPSIHDDSSVSRDKAKYKQQGSKETLTSGIEYLN